MIPGARSFPGSDVLREYSEENLKSGMNSYSTSMKI
jgi:hypothetical protein